VKTNNPKTNPIEDAILYIENNYNAKITIEDLAQQVLLSPYYFSRIFKKETGYSPYEYIIIYRINVAKKLLRETDLTIKEIAYMTGFHSESHFVTTFRQHAEYTPLQFRKMPF
jgi:AraC-like DNA-binding protein